MSIETDFRALLAGHGPLSAIVGNKVALNAIPEGAKPPLVVFGSAHDRTLGLDGSVLADLCTLSVQCWADTATAADALADAVIAAVSTAPQASGAAVTDRASTFDVELGLDGVTLTVEWWA